MPHRGFRRAERVEGPRQQFERDTCWLEGDALWCTTGHDSAPEQVLDRVEEFKSRSAAYCTRRKDRSVWCLGRNLSLGNPAPEVPAAEPTQVPGLGAVRDVAVVNYGACAIHDGGSVSCWGGAPSSHAWNQKPWFIGTPRTIPLSGSATAIVVTESGACALVDGHAQCWGSNGQVQDVGAAGALMVRVDRPCWSTAEGMSCLDNDARWFDSPHVRQVQSAPPLEGRSTFSRRCWSTGGRIRCESRRERLVCPLAEDSQNKCTLEVDEIKPSSIVPKRRTRGTRERLIMGAGGVCSLAESGALRCSGCRPTTTAISSNRASRTHDRFTLGTPLRAP